MAMPPWLNKGNDEGETKGMSPKQVKAHMAGSEEKKEAGKKGKKKSSNFNQKMLQKAAARKLAQ